jgi:hypothetical protein
LSKTFANPFTARHGNPSPTFYCSRECQATDYKQHKTTACRDANARKQLWRGAKLAQQMFFVYREATFDQIIPKVEVDGEYPKHSPLIVVESGWFRS